MRPALHLPSPHEEASFGVPRGPGPSDVEIEGRVVRLTNLDRVLWPRTGTTKGDMIEYYARVAPLLLPHVGGRPLTLGRFPMGIDGPGWAQTDCRGRPEWMPTAAILLRTGERRNHCVVNDLPSLLWVANQGAIELHPFLWRVEGPEIPVELIMDLDPGEGVGFPGVCEVALEVREELDRVGLSTWPMTTGATGLHVHAPVQGMRFEDTKALAKDIARRLVERRPRLVTDRMARSLRAGKVFIDWSQNDPRKSSIAPYSLRAATHPSAALRLPWSQVESCAGSFPATIEGR